MGKSDYVICQCSLMLILFFMTSTTGQQTVTIHVLPIISRSKVNQTIKFSQLLENNITNITKRSGTSLLLHFLHDFWIKRFPALCFMNWPNFIAWLSLPLEILDNMCIEITCPVRKVTNFEVNLSFHIMLFHYITIKSEQKGEYLKNEKSF